MTTSHEETVRAFIAADPGEAVRAELLRIQQRLGKAIDPERMKISWPSPETLHLTLLFPGDIPAARIPDILHSMEQALQGGSAFEMTLGAVDYFGPPNRPRVLWAGLVAPPELFDLQSRLARALQELGICTEERAFHPHFTLGRIKRGRPDESFFLAVERARVEPLSMTVRSVDLFRSELAAGGARHTRLGSVALRPLR